MEGQMVNKKGPRKNPPAQGFLVRGRTATPTNFSRVFLVASLSLQEKAILFLTHFLLGNVVGLLGEQVLVLIDKRRA